ncbi:MAG: N-acetylmuramoyl-L-alanine amidase family protein [Candidatus Caldatribacteriaceae bacterium]
MISKLDYHRFKWFLVFLIFFLSPSWAWARVEGEFDGQPFTSKANIKNIAGTSYVAVETLFDDLGGIAYYSPIMKKVHLRLGRKTCTLSLDKKTIVIGEEESPIQENDVLVEENVVYISVNLLKKLFAITIGSSPASPTIAPTVPYPQVTEAPSRGSLLLGIRYYTYEQEARTRVTLDFAQKLPSYSYEIDRSKNRLDVFLRECTLQDVPPQIPVNDKRISRIEAHKTNGGVTVSFFFTEMVGVKEGKLPGEKPRIYFDLVSLIEAETKPTTTSPVTTPKPTPQVTSPKEPPSKTETPAPLVEEMNRLNPKVIVIDPGHGGKDPGCVHNGYQEKDIVLKVAQLLKSSLEKEGFQVFLTRSGDTYPTLEERYNLVNKKLPLVFVSLHCNSAPSPSASGIEVFVGNSRPKGEGALDVAQRENQLFMEERTDVNQTVIDSLLSTAYYLTSREASLELGTLLVEKVCAYTGQVKRGVKEAPLVVLRNIYSPALLVEIGFLSNTKEAKNLASSSFQSKIAQGMAEAIKAFSQSEKVRKLLEE